MAKTTAATLQTAWDCRFSRPGYRVTGVPDQLQPETIWVCVRTGFRRCLAADECEDCPHWQAEPERH